MTFLSRKARVKKLSELVKVCEFVDFDKGEYKVLFPYPRTKEYAEFEGTTGRLVNYVDTDGIALKDSVDTSDCNSQQERQRWGGRLVGMINRRICYLFDRYRDIGKIHINGRSHPGKSERTYD